MKRSRMIVAIGLMLALGTTSACVVRAHGRVRSGAVVVYEEPPPPRAERVEVRSGFVWVKGHHEWRGGSWAWVPGHWERQRSGYQWQDGRWEHRGNSWHWVSGEWVVHSGGTVADDRPQVRDHRTQPPGPTPPPVVHPNPVVDHRTHPPANPPPVVVQPTGPTVAPPPLRVENPGAARRGFIWIRGHYEWRNRGYQWIPGHWERKKANMVWFDGSWELRGNVYVWTPGGWRAAASGSVHDRRTH